jgi:inorganic pyrophosphatase
MPHLWHDIHPGPDVPTLVMGIVEISCGSKAKYEVDKATGILRLDRVLHGAMHYPINYGIVPRSLGQDGDPFDILVHTQVALQPGTLVLARPVGLLRMVDQGAVDDKLLCTAANDPSVAHIQSLADVPPHLLAELSHFFEEYTQLEGKKVQVLPYGSQADAYQALTEALVRYSQDPRFQNRPNSQNQ